MIHPIHTRYADLLLDYSIQVKEQEYIALNLETGALPLLRPLYIGILERGAYPITHVLYPEQNLDYLTHAQDWHFERPLDVELFEINRVQSWLRVAAPENLNNLQNTDKSKISRYIKQMRPVQNIRVKQTKWCTTLYPTAASAQAAGMSLTDYEQFAYNAMFLLDDDPVARWKEIEVKQTSLIARLREADKVRIVNANTDLTLSVKGRTWINSSGRRNMPCGEVFTSPIEHSANGVITHDIPSSVSGVEVRNIRLTFQDGKVTDAHAEVGNDFLQQQLSTDAGARYLGELGIGTNYSIQKPSMSILYDEKIGGTVHLALGQAYEESGGTNESAIHWDMICDLRQGGAIYLDGELFQENGQFV